jgi:protein-S-isoprenylcysteine O-methyltransferase Ste14
MLRFLCKLAGLALTIACIRWVLVAPHSAAVLQLLIWGVPLLTFPISLAGRMALERWPSPSRAQGVNLPVHYAMVLALGVGLFPGFRLVLRQTVTAAAAWDAVSLALVCLTGTATALTVVNLGARGLGAPFAVKLSSRLATDWMYSWTRNPMLLCAFLWLVALALRHQAWWALLWLTISVIPGWIFFVKHYEERELELRFGASYVEYRARTPFCGRRSLPQGPRAIHSTNLFRVGHSI